MILTSICGYLLLVNLLAYLAFGIDKARARNGDWWLSEFQLLSLGLLGGWLGAKLGQRRFRHKTRKEPFRTLLNYVPLVWLATGLVSASPLILPKAIEYMVHVSIPVLHARPDAAPEPAPRRFFQPARTR